MRQPKTIEIPERFFEGLPDDDSGMWRGLKAYFQEKKYNALQQAKVWLETQPAGMWCCHTEYHWSRLLKGKRLDFWPSTKKWQWDGRVYQGDLESLIGFCWKRDKGR